MAKVTVDKKEDHHARHTYLAVFLVVVIMAGIFAVWYLQIRQTLLADAGDQVSETVEDAKWQMSEVQQVQKQIEQVIPGLNNDLDLMIKNVRSALQQQVIEARALDAVAQELTDDLEAQNETAEIIYDTVATQEVATAESAILE